MMIVFNKTKGFTLLEMAIVLAIIGFILGGLLVSLTAQRDIKDYSQTLNILDDYKDALIGYTLTSRHLPCPDTTNDGVEDFNAATGMCLAPQGNLPWATLSLPDRDAWNQRFIYRVTTAFSQRTPLNTFNLTTTGSLWVCNEAACNAPRLTDTAIAVIVSTGRNRGVCSTLPSLPACADERSNDDNNNYFVSHEERTRTALNPNAEYDDLVVWLSSNILMNRMVAAGQLP